MAYYYNHHHYHHNLLRSFFLSFYLLLLSATTTLATLEAKHLQLTHKVHVRSAEMTTSISARSLIDCTARCLSKEGCKSVSFDTATKVCDLNDFIATETSPYPEVTFEETSIYIEVEVDSTNSWEMVFRATAGIGKPVFDAWNWGSNSDVHRPTADNFGCLTVQNLPCDTHFRFKGLDDIEQVEEAKFALYKDGEPVAHFTSRVLESVWEWDYLFGFGSFYSTSMTDLIGTPTFVSKETYIYGEGYCHRRFFLTKVEDTELCNGYEGWFFVADFRGGDGACCPFEDVRASKPQFRYSYTGRSAMYRNVEDFDFADVFAVFIRRFPEE